MSDTCTALKPGDAWVWTCLRVREEESQRLLSQSINLEHVIPRDDDFEHACRDAFQNEPEGVCLVRRVIGQLDKAVNGVVLRAKC